MFPNNNQEAISRFDSLQPGLWAAKRNVQGPMCFWTYRPTNAHGKREGDSQQEDMPRAIPGITSQSCPLKVLGSLSTKNNCWARKKTTTGGCSTPKSSESCLEALTCPGLFSFQAHSVVFCAPRPSIEKAGSQEPAGTALF